MPDKLSQITESLHPQLRHDCIVMGRFTLCWVLLMKDANFPWVILVPDRKDITEIYQLSNQDQSQLLHESSVLAKILTEVFDADKLNIAALGNVVPQLHIHHIVRYKNDAAWPAPVWGNKPAKPYSEKELAVTLEKFREAMPEDFDFMAQK